jgi:hypothetical protein
MCLGLGNYTPLRSAEYYLQTWNGSTWSAPFAAIAGSRNDEFSAVSCSSARFCIAGGSTTPTRETAPLAATWNGTSWTISKLPAPRSPEGSSLYEVSCASARFCAAVGTRYLAEKDALPQQEGFAETWNGRKWALTRQLRPRNKLTTSYLSGVSCRSPHECVAVGGSYRNYTVTSLQVKTMVALSELWNGSKWKQVTAPASHGWHGQLADVSCWSARGCVAVGFNTREPLRHSLLADRWNGRKWTAAKPPASGPSPALNAVSCASAASCLAVGGNGGDRHYRGLADYWNGHTWKRVPAALPRQGSGSSNGDALFGAACAGPADCLALGAAGPYEGASPVFDYFFAERWNGTSLKLIPSS